MKSRVEGRRWRGGQAFEGRDVSSRGRGLECCKGLGRVEVQVRGERRRDTGRDCDRLIRGEAQQKVGSIAFGCTVGALFWGDVTGDFDALDGGPDSVDCVEGTVSEGQFVSRGEASCLRPISSSHAMAAGRREARLPHHNGHCFRGKGLDLAVIVLDLRQVQ
ncbi:hypothetical protein F5X68DRAFT_22254 [Plectosphaerella plurivora]|uniref:Uncharacterized protein n=1 Tax=Plectosphaerella plurivora TaxID=936078 RepID=A0A9P8V9G9_9PEZI|nr:hypothetical protein F5X68DRAFT_22254 [Plectosphaerella plurivora]